jgi:hypothetical protein
MADETKLELNPKQVEEFMATARKRFQQAMDDEKPLREQASLDLRFVAGDQWDETVKMAREKAGRAALSFPRCHTFVQQVANEARQNKPQIKFIPTEENDKDTAEVYEGLARHIQYSSDAQIAYETAVEYSAGGSFGYFRFLTDYCDEETLDQELKVVPVYDPFSVYGVLVPACYGMEPKFAFVTSEIPRDEYEQLYPKSDVTKNWDDCAKKYSGWIGTDTVTVAEYWYVEEEQLTLTVGKKSRPVTKRTVKFCKINGVECLPGSETDWAGKSIPIIPVLGKLLFVDGKPKLTSVVRHQRDAQKLINLYKTRIAETLSVAPIQPYMVPRGAITKDIKDQWQTLNTIQRPYLEYEVVDPGGKPLPPPQRQVFESPIASLSEAAAQEIDDMKATAGIYDASLGKESNETSGIALARRQQQADVTNLHFMDNLERAFKKGGEVIAQVIPVVYDAERMVRILGEDEAPKVVKINAAFQEGNQQKFYKIGGEGVGKYDVIVTMGRSFSTKRMESFDMMSQVIQANPNILPMVGDIFFRNSDIAGSDQLADRFKKMLPPNLQDDEEGQQPIPPQAQAAIAQAQQENQALHAYAQEKEKEIAQYKAGAQVKQAEMQHKENLEAMRLDFEKWKHSTALGLQDKKISADATLKSAQIESNEATAIFNKEVEVAMHGQQLDAQAAANDAKSAAEEI